VLTSSNGQWLVVGLESADVSPQVVRVAAVQSQELLGLITHATLYIAERRSVTNDSYEPRSNYNINEMI
jgi:hypothetical protein